MRHFQTNEGIRAVEEGDEYLIQPSWKELSDVELLQELSRYNTPTRESVEAERKWAYQQRSDPLYMQWQYDQTPAAEQLWRAEVAAIKQEYPWPV